LTNNYGIDPITAIYAYPIRIRAFVCLKPPWILRP